MIGTRTVSQLGQIGLGIAGAVRVGPPRLRWPTAFGRHVSKPGNYILGNETEAAYHSVAECIRRLLCLVGRRRSGR